MSCIKMTQTVLVVLGFAFAHFILATADEPWQLIPSCAKAFLWTVDEPNYWQEKLEQPFNNNANSHSNQEAFVLFKVYEDQDKLGVGAEKFNDCISDPKVSDEKYWEAHAKCRDIYLPDQLKETAQSLLNTSDDVRASLEAVITGLEQQYNCPETNDRKCNSVKNYRKCIESNTN